jgi:predicted permease
VFSKDADRIDTPDVVISYPYWQRRFGGRPDVLGTTVTVRNAVLTIIGVAAKGFVGETSGQQPDLWIPLGQQPSVLTGNSWLRDTPPNKVMWLHVFGRLTPGVTLPEAEAQANGLLQAGLESFYGTLATGERRREFLDQRLEIRHAARGASSRRGDFSGSLSALLAGVGLLLAIACANLANLLLARGAARKTEMTVRLSLGASRGRLIRQLVTESLALAALGGVAAIGVAYGLHQLLVRMLAESDPNFRMSFALDPLVLGFLIAATVTAGLLFGVLPAWQATRTDAVAALREQGRGTIGSRAQMRPGRALVSVQLALSLPLLVGAALLVQTAYNLQRVDLGFPSSRVLLARVDLREVATDNVRRDALRREILGHLQRIPGVRAASFSQHGLFTGSYSSLSIAVEGYTRKGDIDPDVELDMVGPGYFSTLGVPLSLGRDILESDRSETLKVCVINEAFAQEFFEGRNPIALHVSTIGDDGTRTTYEVVGVAKNARTNNLRGDVRPRFFVVASQRPMSGAFPTFLIRSNVEPSSITTAVRQAIQRADPALPIASVRTAGIQMAPLTAQDRTTAQLAVVFGCVALALAAIGLYGVLSYGVARRTGEIAIRIALGARPGRVLSMILLETFWFVGAGVLLGGVLAYAASSLIGSRLYGVAPQDPLTFAMASALLLTVAFSAAYAPARRASRLEPIAALRRD